METVRINDQKENLGKDMEPLSQPRQLENGLPYQGVFCFGSHKGYLHLPQAYDPAKKFPLILFLAGRGGDALIHNYNSLEFSAFRDLCSESGYVVAVPAYGSDCWLNREAETIVLEMLTFLQSHLSLESDKILMMGCSMGGGSALVFSGRHPDKVIGVCDVFGITDYLRFYREGAFQQSIGGAFGGSPDVREEYYRERSAVTYLKTLASLPVLVFHGDQDCTVPIWNSEILVKGLQKHGGKVTYHIVPGMVHSNAIIKGHENTVLEFFQRVRQKAE